MDLLTMFYKGGIMMYFILLLSIAAGYIVIERYLTLRRSRPSSGRFEMSLRMMLGKKDLDHAKEFAIQDRSPSGRVVLAALEKVHHNPGRVREAIEDQGREEIAQLEKHLGILASVAGIAPMLGFLGTVLGMITTFQAVAATGGQASPVELADGIWEALITTAFGLFVGILAYGAYNWLVAKTQEIAMRMERVGREILDVIEEELHVSVNPTSCDIKIRTKQTEVIK
ncbi:MAG: MotA/TolQ/ExbB proton channel family protein [Bacteroidota bacterium]|nr:MotA/TolQ/ExbB proton channel family protein [Bacteroidota bacterium]